MCGSKRRQWRGVSFYADDVWFTERERDIHSTMAAGTSVVADSIDYLDIRMAAGRSG